MVHSLAQKAVGAGDAIVTPLQSLFRRRGEHGKQAHRVSAVLIDCGLWVDAIVL